MVTYFNEDPPPPPPPLLFDSSSSAKLLLPDMTAVLKQQPTERLQTTFLRGWLPEHLSARGCESIMN